MARQTRVKSWWLSVVDIVKNSDGHYRPVVDVVFPDELIANLVPNELQDPKKQRRRLVDASTNTRDVVRYDLADDQVRYTSSRVFLLPCRNTTLMLQ